ncbi:molybdopterin-guanine dinucleotide biosynthesis protein B [Cohnella sp. GCM10027633]|uniref:molybdopterin-guanine dinucleotide biosynthesis protein B n=1 Tax=unclassified Cohnella TaxID=2636738 RepID=UPI003639D67C
MIVLQIVGYKNAGKTTLATAAISRLSGLGYSVGAVKRDAHDFEPDVPGTDSYRHRQAGAYMTAITSDSRTAWTIERPNELDELLANMRVNGVEVAIVEGFKTAPHPKLVLLRDEADIELLRLSNIVAVGLREPNERLVAAAARADLPIFDIGDKQLDELLIYISSIIAAAIHET